jgi:Icc-related predicted phosphoesterase
LIGKLVRKIDVPYLFVPGNHDSPINRVTLGNEPNVTLLSRKMVNVKGVDILGWADPRFTAHVPTSADESSGLIEQSSKEIAAAVAENQPDVLAVHEEGMAADSIGSVPLVLTGHTHERSIEEIGGTVIMTVGSTGATGLGSFIVEGDRPYEAEIVYFRDGRAVAYDYVMLSGLGGDFQVERQTLNETP